MKKAWIALALVLVLALSPFAYAEPSGKLVIWEHTSQFEEAGKAVIAAFQEKYPDVSVDFQVKTSDQYYNLLATAFQAGEAPDLFWTNGTATTNMPAYAQQGLLMDLTDKLDHSIFSDTTMKIATVDGKVYSSPTASVDGRAVFYNKDIFNELGLSIPKTFEEFEAILGICRDYGIIPNFTTSGFGITKELAAICKEFCGAVAVSWYRDEYTTNAINTLIEAGVKTNIHYVLTKDTVLEALWRLKNSEFTAGVNAIIFLLHKPVGMGTAEKVITIDDSQFRELLDYIENRDFRFKIGFDSCSVPALIRDDSKISDYSLDTCEGARWSAYITPDMKMLPCSFDNQAQKWAVDLRKKTILEAWNSPQFEDFRNCFRSACPHCPKRDMCMGGCPICPEIVLCSEKSA